MNFQITALKILGLHIYNAVPVCVHKPDLTQLDSL